jgi:hypothetical protein
MSKRRAICRRTSRTGRSCLRSDHEPRARLLERTTCMGLRVLTGRSSLRQPRPTSPPCSVLANSTCMLRPKSGNCMRGNVRTNADRAISFNEKDDSRCRLKIRCKPGQCFAKRAATHMSRRARSSTDAGSGTLRAGDEPLGTIRPRNPPDLRRPRACSNEGGPLRFHRSERVRIVASPNADCRRPMALREKSWRAGRAPRVASCRGSWW